jgi:hypothetical protein
MTPSSGVNSPSRSLWRKILASFSLEWLTILPDLYFTVRHWWSEQYQGMYEILDYDSTLELMEANGETAVFIKRQRVKFLQNNIIAFQDYAWGDGEIFADYHCSPGVVVDRYQEGDRWNVLISLRETKNRGDIEDFHIQRTVRNTYTQSEEWRQVEIRHPTRRLKIAIIFPKERRCQRATLLQRSRHQTTVLGPDHFTDLPDGRQILTWETTKIKQFEIYTIRWRW